MAGNGIRTVDWLAGGEGGAEGGAITSAGWVGREQSGEGGAWVSSSSFDWQGEDGVSDMSGPSITEWTHGKRMICLSGCTHAV